MNVKKDCIKRLSRRSLKASRKRNVIAVIAIAMTELLFTALFTVAMSINSSCRSNSSLNSIESIDLTAVLSVVSFLVLIALTGYLIISNIFYISVSEDVRFFGLLKTIGVTNRQLKTIIRRQALWLCAVGIPVGLLPGYGIGAALMPKIMAQTVYGANKSVIDTSPLIFIFSAVFAILTVLISSSKPSRIAARISPTEASKYIFTPQCKTNHSIVHGAKIHQMAFTNVQRNKKKTALVIISLSLSVVLMNSLVTFTNGFDMEKYVSNTICADFIVSNSDYFNFNPSNKFISQNDIDKIKSKTSHSLFGCGYAPTVETKTPNGCDAQIEGLDSDLLEKLNIVKGDLTPMLRGSENAIALQVDDDDSGNAIFSEDYPPIGSKQTVTYVYDGYYIDSRTGEKSNQSTPQEFLKYRIVKGNSVDYTVCAYVTVPNSMSYRYILGEGFSFVLPSTALKKDSNQNATALFCLFDSPNTSSEKETENYLKNLTFNNTELLYESKSTVKSDFTDFQDMFLTAGGVLCAVVGVIGILNFFNSIMTGIMSRKREFAMLSAIGMTNGQLKKLLICEGLLYALSSAAVALAFSAAIGPLTETFLTNMFWFFSPNFTILPIAISIPVFIFIGLLIPAIMYRNTQKHGIAEQLRDF